MGTEASGGEAADAEFFTQADQRTEARKATATMALLGSEH